MPAEAPEVQELMRKVRWRLRRWQDDPEWPDILAESYLRAWQSYQQALKSGFANPMGAALHAAGWGPASWLRRWHGEKRRDDARYRAVHESLDELARRLDSDDPCSLSSLAALIDPSPGPEALALEHLERRALWEWLKRRATPRQLAVLARFFVAGEDRAAAAQALSIRPQVAGRIRDDALARCRVSPEELPTFPQPATSYPRCRRGHYLAPENLTAERRDGELTRYRCRLCANRNTRDHRARNAQGPGAGRQQTARGLRADPGYPPTENAPEIAP